MSVSGIRSEATSNARFEGGAALGGLAAVKITVPFVIGVASILASLGGLVTWSVTTKLSSAVIVPGTVVVDSGRKLVQHLTGGMVKSLSVREGERVLGGQVLMRLDDKSLADASEALKRLFAMNVASQRRLQAEQDGTDFISCPRKPQDVAGPLWQDICHQQESLFQRRHEALFDKIETLKSDGQEASAVAQIVDNQIQSHVTRIMLTKAELNSALSLAKSGFESRQRIIEISRSIAELQEELAGLRSKRLDSEQAYRHDMLEARQYIAAFSESAGLELQQARRDEVDLTLKLRDVQKQIAAMDIKAPISGLVVNMTVHTVGGVIGAGATILEIVPVSDPLVLEAKLRPEDIENVRVGLPVDIRMVGPKSQQLPRIVGAVAQVSADRLEDPIKETAFFRVRVEVRSTALRDAGAPGLKPGMAVILMIRRGEQTPLAYLADPIVGFFERALK